MLDQGLALCVIDGVVKCLGELPAWVPAPHGHLAFGLVDELAGGGFPQPHGHWGENFQEAEGGVLGLGQADPDKIPAGQLGSGGIRPCVGVGADPPSSIEGI